MQVWLRKGMTPLTTKQLCFKVMAETLRSCCHVWPALDPPGPSKDQRRLHVGLLLTGAGMGGAGTGLNEA